jgi:LPS-assembly lipoprotein
MFLCQSVSLTLARVLALGLLSVVLTSCGFHLRNSQVFSFETIALPTGPASPIATDIARHLGDKVIPEQHRPGARAAQVVLDILQEQREKTVVAVNASGQVRELQLLIRLRFKVRTPQGDVLLSTTEITQHRDITFNETSALAKEAEELLLYRDMQNDIVQQVLRRLAAVKLPPA